MKRCAQSTVVAAIALAVALASGCSKPARPPAAAPVLVGKSFATNIPVDIQPQPVGHVVAFSTVAVRPQIGGVLQHVHFTEGAEVKSNQLLFTIDPHTAQDALSRDEAQLENAEIQFAREQKLFDQKLISQDEYDTSRANRDTLTAKVDSDKLNLSYTEIRAPFDGIAGSVQFHEGNVVKAQDDVLLIINRIHPIYVQFAVPERYLSEIRKQMTQHTLAVSAAYENLTDTFPQGELVFVDNSVDTSTGTIQLKATFPNENNVLWPGQFVKVNLTLSEMKNAVVVPTQALQTGQNGQFLYVLKPDETVDLRPVTATITINGVTVIEKGLNPGETVVTDGQLRLFPGAKVDVKKGESEGTK